MYDYYNSHNLKSWWVLIWAAFAFSLGMLGNAVFSFKYWVGSI